MADDPRETSEEPGSDSDALSIGSGIPSTPPTDYSWDYPSPEDEDDACPICHQAMFEHEPTALLCGHVFHDYCISKYFRTSDQCPVCKRREVLDGNGELESVAGLESIRRYWLHNHFSHHNFKLNAREDLNLGSVPIESNVQWWIGTFADMFKLELEESTPMRAILIFSTDKSGVEWFTSITGTLEDGRITELMVWFKDSASGVEHLALLPAHRTDSVNLLARAQRELRGETRAFFLKASDNSGDGNLGEEMGAVELASGRVTQEVVPSPVTPD
jgi:hypothetical protein